MPYDVLGKPKSERLVAESYHHLLIGNLRQLGTHIWANLGGILSYLADTGGSGLGLADGRAGFHRGRGRLPAITICEAEFLASQVDLPETLTRGS